MNYVFLLSWGCKRKAPLTTSLSQSVTAVLCQNSSQRERPNTPSLMQSDVGNVNQLLSFSVDWVIWPVKNRLRYDLGYNVFGGTLNHTQLQVGNVSASSNFRSGRHYTGQTTTGEDHEDVRTIPSIPGSSRSSSTTSPYLMPGLLQRIGRRGGLALRPNDGQA